MSDPAAADDALILLQESSYRLLWAHKYERGDDPRVLCEHAHDAIETALNAVIIAAGGKYRHSHDLSVLANAAQKAKKPIPKELESIRELPLYHRVRRVRLAEHGPRSE